MEQFCGYLSGGDDWRDSAYNIGLDLLFDNILHTADTLTIEWFASGSGWQGTWDESWAIDNVRIRLHGAIPEPNVFHSLLDWSPPRLRLLDGERHRKGDLLNETQSSAIRVNMIGRALLVIAVLTQISSCYCFSQSSASEIRSLEEKFDEWVQAHRGFAKYGKQLASRINDLEQLLQTERDNSFQLRQNLREEKERRRLWKIEYLRAFFPA